MVIRTERASDNRPILPEGARIVIDEFGIVGLNQSMQRGYPNRLLCNGEFLGGKYIQENADMCRKLLRICMEFIQRVLGQVQLGEQMAAR